MLGLLLEFRIDLNDQPYSSGIEEMMKSGFMDGSVEFFVLWQTFSCMLSRSKVLVKMASLSSLTAGVLSPTISRSVLFNYVMGWLVERDE